MGVGRLELPPLRPRCSQTRTRRVTQEELLPLHPRATHLCGAQVSPRLLRCGKRRGRKHSKRHLWRVNADMSADAKR
jgi:hypothetical protein